MSFHQKGVAWVLLLFGLALLRAQPSHAADMNLWCLTGTSSTGGPSWQPASAANPCPTTGSGGGGSNASVGATGSAVPGSATYLGINIAGTLTGLTAGQATMANSVPVAIASNQSNIPVNEAQINGVTPLMGNGVSGTGSQRVNIASDNTAFNVNAINQVNVTPTDCSGTITSGGTAQNAFTAQTTLHGFTIANIDAVTGSGEVLNMSFTGTAAAATAGSYPLAAPTATTLAGLSSFTSPPGFGLNHALSVIGATTGHKFSCTWW